MLLFLMNSLYCGDVSSPVRDTHQQLQSLIASKAEEVFSPYTSRADIAQISDNQLIEEFMQKFHAVFDEPYAQQFNDSKNKQKLISDALASYSEKMETLRRAAVQKLEQTVQTTQAALLKAEQEKSALSRQSAEKDRAIEAAKEATVKLQQQVSVKDKEIAALKIPVVVVAPARFSSTQTKTVDTDDDCDCYKAK